jgi:glycosyltransferase involved in cell wall biosynthesis
VINLKKKKLLVFGYTMEMGGAEKALVDTLNYLHDKCEIDLYLLEKKGTLLDNIPDDVNVYQMKNNIFSYILFRYIPFFRKRYINNIANKKDYGYAFGYMEGRAGTWVADIEKEMKKYAWIHNDVMKYNIGITDDEAKNTYNNVDKVICVSKDAKKVFCEKYGILPSKVEVIYNFIDEEKILKLADEFNVDNNGVFTFVNVAKMRDQKRQDRLVNAAVYLKQKKYDFKLQLVGDGPNLEKIRDMVIEKDVSDKVEVLGLKSNPYPYIKNADVFVLSSYMEGYGIVIKEALLLKKKIITTDVVGPREILDDGKYGIIVNNNDDDIKYAMEDIMINQDKYCYLDKNLRKYKGDNEKIMKETLKLLDL